MILLVWFFFLLGVLNHSPMIATFMEETQGQILSITLFIVVLVFYRYYYTRYGKERENQYVFKKN